MCNTGTFNLEALEQQDDIDELLQMLRNHLLYTGSTVAEKILSHWQTEQSRFVKVMPIDYKRVLQEMAASAANKLAIS